MPIGVIGSCSCATGTRNARLVELAGCSPQAPLLGSFVPDEEPLETAALSVDIGSECAQRMPCEAPPRHFTDKPSSSTKSGPYRCARVVIQCGDGSDPPAVALLAFAAANLRAQPRPHFEVAVIHQAGDLAAAVRTGKHIGTRIDGAQVDIGYATLMGLICNAYSVKPQDSCLRSSHAVQELT